MTYLQAIILGIIQGIAEFMPISSSAHLAIAKKLMHIQESSHLFDLTCHFGTFSAAMLFFRREIVATLKDVRMTLLFFLACLPLVPAYFLLKPLIYALSNPEYLFIFLLFSSALLAFASTLKEPKELSFHKIKDVLFIGVMQSTALLPGISRSGSTITAALMRGWEEKEAIRFSFLLAIPTVLGGIFLETLKLRKEGMGEMDFPVFLIAFIMSFICGLFSVRLIYWTLNKKRLRFFAVYLSIAALGAYIIM